MKGHWTQFLWLGLLRLALASLMVSAVTTSAAAQTETIEYYCLDALGSVRVIVNQNGQQIDRMDYGPFGENLKAAIKFPLEQYAQLARDGESGQDYARGRNYSTSTGRLNSTDPVYRGLFQPQRWNRYSYALNNPISYVDPSGLDTVCANFTWDKTANGGEGAWTCSSEVNWTTINFTMIVIGVIYISPAAAWGLKTAIEEQSSSQAPILGSVPNLPANTPQELTKVYQQAFRDADMRLTNPQCAATFGGGGVEAARSAFHSADYRFVPLRESYMPGARSNPAAATSRAGNRVFIDPRGTFVNPRPYVDLERRFVPMNEQWNLSEEDFRSLLLLHELGHLTGALPEDDPIKFPGRNDANTRIVRTNCF